MLVLTRRIGEKLIIRDDIIITLLSIRGLQASLGIDAPKDIKIWREELLKGSNNVERLYLDNE